MAWEFMSFYDRVSCQPEASNSTGTNFGKTVFQKG